MNKNAVREEINSTEVLQRGVEALLAQQKKDGYWEGEVVWCPMLPAQYVLMCHIRLMYSNGTILVGKENSSSKTLIDRGF